jgi:hypothetical protein
MTTPAAAPAYPTTAYWVRALCRQRWLSDAQHRFLSGLGSWLLASGTSSTRASKRPTISTIAESVGVAPVTGHRAIRRACEEGWLERFEEYDVHGRRVPNRYRLKIPAGHPAALSWHAAVQAEADRAHLEATSQAPRGSAAPPRTSSQPRTRDRSAGEPSISADRGVGTRPVDELSPLPPHAASDGTRPPGGGGDDEAEARAKVRHSLTALCSGLSWISTAAATSRSTAIRSVTETLTRLHAAGWTSADLLAAMSELPAPKKVIFPAGLLRNRLERLLERTPPSVARAKAEQQLRAAQLERERQRAHERAEQDARHQACQDAQRRLRAWLTALLEHDRDRWWNALGELAPTPATRTHLAAARSEDPCRPPAGVAHLFEAACDLAGLDHQQLPPAYLDDPFEALLLELG